MLEWDLIEMFGESVNSDRVFLFSWCNIVKEVVVFMLVDCFDNGLRCGFEKYIKIFKFCIWL